MISRHLPLLLAAVAGLLLNSCVATRMVTGKLTHKPYRIDVDADSAHAFDKTVVPVSEGPTGQPVRLGYLEFDDQGELWRLGNQDGGATQLGVVLKDLQQQVSRGPVKVIVYIHGWNNDASPSNEADGNLQNFKQMLAMFSSSCEMPIYGVYVAWRGKIWPKPTFVDVWDRDAAASRVGGPTMLTALQSISSTAHRDKQSTVIMVGHSFGGKILTRVASQHLAGEIGHALGENKREIIPLADTVVVVNSATNGQEMRQINELLRVNDITYRRGKLDLPLFVTVSSTSDFYVRSLLPVYLRLNRDVLAIPDRGGDYATTQEHRALYTAMGHNPDLINFDFKGTPHPKIDWKKSSDLAEATRNAVFWNVANGKKATNDRLDLTLFTDASGGHETYSVHPSQSSGYHSPQWGFRVPAFVVAGHSDIWEPNLVAIVAALHGMTRAPLPSGHPTATPKLELQKPVTVAPTQSRPQ